jgi:hypothetical protein
MCKIIKKAALMSVKYDILYTVADTHNFILTAFEEYH